MATSQARFTMEVSKGPKPRGWKKKKGKGIKETNREQQEFQDRKSGRELAVEQAKKQGKPLEEVNRLRGKRVSKPKGGSKKKTPAGPKIKSTSKSIKATAAKTSKTPAKKSSKKSTTSSKKTVAVRKPRTYSEHPEAIRSRQRRAIARAAKQAEQKPSRKK